jgi:hypothetical protein
MVRRTGTILAAADVEQPAGVGSTEPAEREGAGSAGAEAAP